MFSRQNLQGATRPTRTASLRSTPYGEEVVILGLDHAASMGIQVCIAMRLSETLQPLCSCVPELLQGALNAVCSIACSSCVPPCSPTLLHACNHIGGGGAR
jgi:hypothetical protein